MDNKKRLVLLDSHAIIHRAYHALPKFSSGKGEPTGALYGLVAMLLRIGKELKPDYVVACYDLPGPTFRHAAFEKYKVGRPKAEDDLVHQIKRSRDILGVFGIPIYDAPGFEADDILGTIIEKLSGLESLEIIIASGDMDTLQLVDKARVSVYTLKKGFNETISYNEEAVKKRFGFSPKLLPDWKGLCGDPSDNIPGIRGIGEKTASELISKFGSIEEIYRKLNKDESVFIKAGIKERVIKLLREGQEEAEFSKTLASIRKDAPIDFKLPEKTWREGINQAEADKLFTELEFRTLRGRLREFLNENGEKISDKKGETGNFSEEFASQAEIEELGIAVWLLNSDLTDPKLDDILSYAGTGSFKEAREKILRELADKKLDKIYREIELPLIPIIKAMEKRGILIDVPYLKKLSEEYHSDLSKIEARIWKLAGTQFNLNSPKQLSEILFDRLKLTAKGLKKTEGGARSTRLSELEKLRGEHPIVEEIMSHRELQKILSTYVDAIPPLVDSSGRLHARFIQTGTTTGRFSSVNPNLQNIPIKGDFGKKVRRAFVATKGYQFLALDYSQIELRILAIVAQDPVLIKIFKDGKDVHTSVASRVFGVKEEEVTSDMRRQAKTINFGIIYGMGITALKEALGTDRAEAEAFYNNYFEKFPRVESYIEGIKKSARKKGYTETLFGRRRYFPALRSSIPYLKAAAERMAVNAPLQGTAADIIKIAIKKANDELKKAGILDKAYLILQIHDELVYEVEETVLEEVKEITRKVMENALPEILNPEGVPISVSASSGRDWGELK